MNECPEQSVAIQYKSLVINDIFGQLYCDVFACFLLEKRHFDIKLD